MSANGSPVSQPPNVPLDDDDDDDLGEPMIGPTVQASGSPTGLTQQAAPTLGAQTGDLQAMQTMVMSLAQTAQQTLMMVSQQNARAQQQPSDSNGGFNLANKVLKYPEAFGSENADQDALGWLAWSTSFRNWVTFAEPAYENDLAEVERRLTEIPHVVNMPPACVERARKLYVILSSVLKGRPLAILRGVEERNGFECWRQLTCQFSPRTRSRSLAMLSAIMGLPAFSRDRTLREQLMNFERLIAEYEKASGNTLPGDVKLSVVLKCIPKALQSHVHLRMDSSTTYEDVKSLVLSYEVSTTNWSAARVQQELGLVNLPKSAVAMDVDQEGSVAQIKGDKGKGKGKGKDGKGKKGDKGKPKDAPSPKGKPKAKPKASPDSECHYCHKKGHYKRDCRKYKADLAAGKVRAVTDDEGGSASPTSPTPKAAPSAPTPKAAVKRIMFDIREDSPTAYSSVRAVQYDPCQSDPCAVQDDPCQSDPCAVQDDPCQSDPCAVQCDPCQSDPCAVQDDPCQSDPRAVQVSCSKFEPSLPAGVSRSVHFDMTGTDQDGDWDHSPASATVRVAAVSRPSFESPLEICVDTAADESCLPLSFGYVGSRASGEPPLVDCQGNAIHSKGSRLATLEAAGVELMERWVVTPVAQPILAAGKMIKQGWRFVDFDDLGMCFTSPSHDARIPIGYSNNTLVCSGVVRAISEAAPSRVSAIKVQLSGLLNRLLQDADYFQEIVPGVHATALTSQHHVDLGLYLPYEGLAYRTTLLKVDGDWVLSELSTSIADLGEDLTSQVAEHAVEMIVFGHREPMSPGELGFSTEIPILDAPAPAAPVVPADPVIEDLSGEVEGAQVEGDGGAAVEAAGGDEAKDDAIMLGALADEGESPRTTIVVDDVELSLDSSLSVLRRACQSLGIGKSGSKAVVFQRLCNQLDKLKLIEANRATEVPNAPVPRVPEAPKEPTPEQLRAHNAVHAPFAPWCEHCVAFKSRDDAHRPASSDRSVPVISFDFGFSNRSEADGPHEKLTFLCIHDAQTGWREALPVPGKAGIHDRINVTSYLAAEICRLLSLLSYPAVVLQTDPEPTCLKLRDEVRRMRSQMGLKTSVRQTPEQSHASNGGAEVAVQTLRQQANTLLSMYEAEAKVKVGTSHPLHAWSFRHASWILNRYVLRPGGLTPYEIVHGRPYSGKVIPFGEVVMGLVSPGPKGKPRFIQALMLGKCVPNDEFILCSGAGKLMLARTVRRLSVGFTPSMHDSIRDQPWRHPGFVAGSLGRSRTQRKPKVHPVSGDAPPAVRDQLGSVSDVLGELAPFVEASRDLPPDELYSPSQVAGSDSEDSMHDDAASSRPEGNAAPALDDPGARPALSHGEGVAGTLLASADSASSPGASAEHARPTTGEPSMSDEVQASGGASAAEPMQVDPHRSSVAEHPPPLADDTAPGPVSKRARIAAATVCGVEYHHADADFEASFSPEDIESLNDLDDASSDGEEEVEGGLSPPEELYRPFSPHEPSLSQHELDSLDALCEQHEVDRLKSMGVLYQQTDGLEGCKSLTVKFVHTWRPKTHPVSGEPVWLRRARLVAREFKFKDPMREGLYSPASQTLLIKLLPALCMSRRGYVLLSCDISDAYLTCAQPCPTVVTLHGATFRLAYMLPGQRDGSAVWFATFTDYLVSEGGISLWPGCEALFALRDHSGGGLLHVDDLLGAGDHGELRKLAQVIEAKYKCTVEWVVREGDSLQFLKRKHTLARDGLLCIQKADKHVIKLIELLHLERQPSKPTPLPLQPLELSESKPLSADQASVFRSCIGILMYVAADVPDLQHAIRMLSQYLAGPTEACMKALKHVVRYAKGTNGLCLGLEQTQAGHGVKVQCDTGADALELFTDSDWASDRSTRKSVSAGALFMNANCIFTASRTQRVVAMSSCEAELNAMVSFAVDLMYVKEALGFVTGTTPDCHVFSDSASARAVVCKQGLSKLKHVEIRLLWVQGALKSGAFKLHPIGTLDNSSDLMTKTLKRERMLYLMYLLNVRDSEAQYTRVGETQAAARDNHLSMKLAIKAVKAFKGPPQRVHALLQALTFMSLIDANQATELDVECHPHAFASALSGCAFILLCFGCLLDHCAWLGMLCAITVCLSLQGCQNESADEFAWFQIGFTLALGFVLALWFWVMLPEAELPQQQACEPDDDASPACDDDATSLNDEIPSGNEEQSPAPALTRASSDEPLSEPDRSSDDAAAADRDPPAEIANDILATVPVAAADPQGGMGQLRVYYAPISGRRWHVFRACWGLRQANAIAEEELQRLLQRDPGITMCLICRNQLYDDLRLETPQVADEPDAQRREHPEPEPFQ